jgi:hypothetical protein
MEKAEPFDPALAKLKEFFLFSGISFIQEI